MNLATLLLLFKLFVYDQPYSLTVQEVTPALLEWCRADDNCMDVVAVDDAEDVGGCTTDADCCAKAPELDPDLCGGK